MRTELAEALGRAVENLAALIADDEEVIAPIRGLRVVREQEAFGDRYIWRVSAILDNVVEYKYAIYIDEDTLHSETDA